VTKLSVFYCVLGLPLQHGRIRAFQHNFLEDPFTSYSTKPRSAHVLAVGHFCLLIVAGPNGYAIIRHRPLPYRRLVRAGLYGFSESCGQQDFDLATKPSR
jgi:hypothetical protein